MEGKVDEFERDIQRWHDVGSAFEKDVLKQVLNRYHDFKEKQKSKRAWPYLTQAEKDLVDLHNEVEDKYHASEGKGVETKEYKDFFAASKAYAKEWIRIYGNETLVGLKEKPPVGHDNSLVFRDEVLTILRATMCEMACKDDMITAVVNLPHRHAPTNKEDLLALQVMREFVEDWEGEPCTFDPHEQGCKHCLAVKAGEYLRGLPNA